MKKWTKILSQVKERKIKRKKRKKKERKEKEERETFVFKTVCWFNVAGTLKGKEERKEKNCFLNLIITCLFVAY